MTIVSTLLLSIFFAVATLAKDYNESSYYRSKSGNVSSQRRIVYDHTKFKI